MTPQPVTLYTTPTGSRLRGLQTPDSDHDHTTIHINPPETYLGYPTKTPATTHTINHTHDHTTHEISAYMRQLHKGNPNTLETLHSHAKTIYHNIKPLTDNKHKYITENTITSLKGMGRNKNLSHKQRKIITYFSFQTYLFFAEGYYPTHISFFPPFFQDMVWDARMEETLGLLDGIKAPPPPSVEESNKIIFALRRQVGLDRLSPDS